MVGFVFDPIRLLMICVYGIVLSLVYLLLYTVHSNLHTCPSHAPRKDYGSKFSVGTMSFPGGYPAEINTLVDTFIFRYKLSHEVAAKLVKCSPGIQWQVISPRAPKVVLPLLLRSSHTSAQNERFEHGCNFVLLLGRME